MSLKRLMAVEDTSSDGVPISHVIPHPVACELRVSRPCGTVNSLYCNDHDFGTPPSRHLTYFYPIYLCHGPCSPQGAPALFSYLIASPTPTFRRSSFWAIAGEHGRQGPSRTRLIECSVQIYSSVGKTSLMNQYVNKRFSNQYKATIGADL